MKNLQDILDAAEQHGREGAPDHEVGDLQDILTYTWETLFPDQKERILAEAAEQLDSWAPEISCPACGEVGIPDCKGCGGVGFLSASGKKVAEA